MSVFNSEKMAAELKAWRNLFGAWRRRDQKRWVAAAPDDQTAEWRAAEQAEMEPVAGVKRTTWSRWENGWSVQQPLMLRRALLEYAICELRLPLDARRYLDATERGRLKILREALPAAQANSVVRETAPAATSA